MVSSILNGIATGIYNAFGTTYEIYTERVEQGFLPPCFFIECTPSIERYRDRRRTVSVPCIISFYATQNSTIYSIIPQLMSAIETITADTDKLHGKDISVTVSDNILTVTVTYSYHIIDSNSTTDMRTLDVINKAKEN